MSSLLQDLEPLQRSALAELEAATEVAALEQAKGTWLGPMASSLP